MTAKLLAALIATESGNNPNAKGDEGRSIGILQITEALVIDINSHFKTTFVWPDDCYHRAHSIKIYSLWLTMHDLRDKPDETVARKWNGGKNGHKSRKTLAYWRKVKKHL